MEKTCGEGAAADVILDESGAALDVICFKPNLGEHDGDASAPADAVTCAESNAHLAPQSDVELGETTDVDVDVDAG